MTLRNLAAWAKTALGVRDTKLYYWSTHSLSVKRHLLAAKKPLIENITLDNMAKNAETQRGSYI
jgi:hypothetical protein